MEFLRYSYEHSVGAKVLVSKEFKNYRDSTSSIWCLPLDPIYTSFVM